MVSDTDQYSTIRLLEGCMHVYSGSLPAFAARELSIIVIFIIIYGCSLCIQGPIQVATPVPGVAGRTHTAVAVLHH